MSLSGVPRQLWQGGCGIDLKVIHFSCLWRILGDGNARTICCRLPILAPCLAVSIRVIATGTASQHVDDIPHSALQAIGTRWEGSGHFPRTFDDKDVASVTHAMMWRADRVPQMQLGTRVTEERMMQGDLTCSATRLLDCVGQISSDGGYA
jgi:hypothetical protein